jgi:uncharacterized protein YbaP (TraB family)
MTTFHLSLVTKRALGALALSFLLPAASVAQPATPRVPSASPPAHKHMLFRVRGPDGATLYLLGSVHLLNAEAGKLPPEVDSAFAQAKTVAFEANLDTIQLRATEILGKARYTDNTTLTSSLGGDAPRVDSLLHLYGLSLKQVDGFKPWFVSMLLTQLGLQRAKFEAQYGVDVQINARAHAAQKPIVGLEPVDVQLNLFDSLSPADQRRMLLEMKGPDSAAVELAKLKDEWQAGDTASINARLNTQVEQSPPMFDVLVASRNKSWMPRLEQLLAGHDDALVVVGAAHLVGKHGVLEMLRAKGYIVDQL